MKSVQSAGFKFFNRDIKEGRFVIAAKAIERQNIRRCVEVCSQIQSERVFE
jgi:predicted type IV restriction endonuclease